MIWPVCQLMVMPWVWWPVARKRPLHGSRPMRGRPSVGFGAEAGPDGGEGAVGQGGEGGQGTGEHFLDGAGAEASIEAGAFLGGAEDDAAVGPLGQAAAGDVEDVAEAQVGRMEGEHVAF